MSAIVLPGPLSDPRNRLLFAVVVSVLLHVLLLVIRFAPPAPFVYKPTDPQLEVVLLNAGTVARPDTPQVLAQVDMVGGGDRNEGRARSPLPAESVVRDGDALSVQRSRVQELEAQQRALMTLAAGKPMAVPPERREAVTPSPQPGADETDTDAAIARLQAQIDRQISDYNQRPRRLTYGVNAVGVSYAMYVDDWASRIEKLGTEHYPEEARGKLYGTLVITVELDRNGKVVDVIVDRPSRHEALNRAVRGIVKAGEPYAPFTEQMAREGDILQIVRTWTFTDGTLATSAATAASAREPEAPAQGGTSEPRPRTRR